MATFTSANERRSADQILDALMSCSFPDSNELIIKQIALSQIHTHTPMNFMPEAKTYIPGRVHIHIVLISARCSREKLRISLSLGIRR